MMATFVLAYAQAGMPAHNPDMRKMPRREKKALERMALTEDTKNAEMVPATVYMFAFSTQLGDSVVYFSEAMPIENVMLTKKNGFLSYRSNYSFQFQQFLNNNYGCKMQTTAVLYDKNQKKLLKRCSKVLKRYMDDNKVRVKIITQDEFKFKLPEFQNVIM